MMNLPTPCIVLIENIDNLQRMFNNEQAAIKNHRGHGMSMGGNGRSMQSEITGYLRALRQRPGVFLMATAEHTGSIKSPLLDLVEPLSEIEILPPSKKERRDVLVYFAKSHPSFTELDVDRIAELSDGLSRREIINASGMATETAYRESLRTGQYSKVKIGDVLVNIAQYIDHDSQLYKAVEDEAVAQLYQDIEAEML